MAQNDSENTDSLTPKQRRFVQEYITDLNATKAATRAGYSAATAKQQGSRLLGDPAVQDAVAEMMAERAARSKITADRVLEELARIATADPDTEEGRDILAKRVRIRQGADGKVTSTVVEYHQESRTKALELLGRHMQLFGKNELDLPGGLTIRVVHE